MGKHRISLYLADDMVKRLQIASNRRKGAKSAIVEEALDQFLNPERRRMLDDATLRRMDRMSASVSAVARDVAIATETLSLFVRYFLTITPPLPHPEQDAARALGRQRFEVFVAQVGRRLASDNRLVTEVLESIAAEKPDLFASAELAETQATAPSPPTPVGEQQADGVKRGPSPWQDEVHG